MGAPWPAGTPGMIRLPSGRLVRGRGLRDAAPEVPPPEFALYLLARPPAPPPWPHRWVRWRDFRVPADRAQARTALAETWERAAGERVEVACGGGTGRTGTALACLAVLDGVPAEQAVTYVRAHYRRRAVETPWQRAYVRAFAAG